DTNGDHLLEAGETWLYTSAGVKPYQATTSLNGNFGTVTATAGGQTYTSTDPAYSQGFVAKVHVQKAINAVDPLHPTTAEDANDPAHPVMLADGTAVTWTYLVTDLLSTPLTFVSLVDDAGTPTNPLDDFSPAPVLSGGFNVGDSNHDNILEFGEAWL